MFRYMHNNNNSYEWVLFASVLIIFEKRLKVNKNKSRVRFLLENWMFIVYLFWSTFDRSATCIRLFDKGLIGLSAMLVLIASN